MIAPTNQSAGIKFLIFSCCYFLWFSQVLNFQLEHLILFLIVSFLYFFKLGTRNGLLSFSPFLFYFMVYDSLRAFPNHNYREVSIEVLYNLEKTLFGISQGNQIITPNELLSSYTHPLLDGIAGVSYILWVPLPLVLAFYLYFTKNKAFKVFTYAFVGTNLLGFCIYYLFPAAPPWYILEQGLEFKPGTLGSTAGLARFDQLIGFPLYENMYAKNASIFAAVPSLHAANPMVCLIIGLWLRSWKIILTFLLLTLGIWLGAVYSFHHYVFDVLSGGLLAFIVTFSLIRCSKYLSIDGRFLQEDINFADR